VKNDTEKMHGPSSRSVPPADRCILWRAVDDWSQLQGLDIEIRDGGEFIDRGRVEVVTGDGSLLWLQQEGATHRRLVEMQPKLQVHIADPVTPIAADRGSRKAWPVCPAPTALSSWTSGLRPCTHQPQVSLAWHCGCPGLLHHDGAVRPAPFPVSSRAHPLDGRKGPGKRALVAEA
jgi:hypothetical protein